MPIVAAVDESERAEAVIDQGRELADLYGVKLHVVHVGDQAATLTPGEDGTPRVDTDAPREAAAEVASEAADRVEDPGEFEAVGLAGDPSEALMEYSAEHDAECIVVSGRKRSAVGKVLFGSVTQSLLLNADRPVVSVPARARIPEEA